jgi:hypothetical protein
MSKKEISTVFLEDFNFNDQGGINININTTY